MHEDKVPGKINVEETIWVCRKCGEKLDLPEDLS